MGIPVEVIRRPGPLDPSDRDVVRGHPALGAQIASRVISAEQAA